MNLTKDDFCKLQGEILNVWASSRENHVYVINTWKFHGKRFADFRLWYLKDDGKYHAGKGVRTTHSDLAHLRKGVRELRKVFEGDR